MRNNGKILGFILLFIGIVWLLASTGVISMSTIRALFDLWPLILIAIGISIIFKGRRYVKAVTWLVLLAVIIGYGYFVRPLWKPFAINSIISGYTSARDRRSSEADESKATETPGHISIEKGKKVERAKMRLKFGATQISLDSGAGNSNLVEADLSDGLTEFIKHFITEKNNDRNAVVEFSMKNLKLSGLDKLNNLSSVFHLNKDVLWELDIETGAVSSELDLTGLKVEKLDIDTGASSYKITLGSYDTKMDIDAGASKLTINLPKDTGIKINIDGALSDTNFDDEGWIKKDGWYYSPEYDSKRFKAEAEIDMGLGSVRVIEIN